jgi:hypothetical protein
MKRQRERFDSSSWVRQLSNIRDSSNGRTGDFGSPYEGSNPSSRSKNMLNEIEVNEIRDCDSRY